MAQASDALRISVESEHSETKTGEKNGKPWSMTMQFAWAHFIDGSGVADKFPSKIQLVLDKGQAPYRIGEYVLSSASFYRGDFNNLSMFARLTPFPVLAK